MSKYEIRRPIGMSKYKRARLGMKPGKQLSFALDEEALAQVDAIAAERGCSRSEAARFLLYDSLDRHE